LTGEVSLRAAREADLPLIVRLEARPDFAAYINRWPAERHARAMAEPDFGYRVFDLGAASIGFAILTGLTSLNAAIQLMRVAVEQPGRGLGRACCRLLLAEAFDRLGAHRFHLDLFEDNERAERLYLSLGLRHEGVLREAERRGSVFRSLKLMAILEPEYRALERAGAYTAD
jgi:diamine N-acetyltransferase